MHNFTNKTMNTFQEVSNILQSQVINRKQTHPLIESQNCSYTKITQNNNRNIMFHNIKF